MSDTVGLKAGLVVGGMIAGLGAGIVVSGGGESPGISVVSSQAAIAPAPAPAPAFGVPVVGVTLLACGEQRGDDGARVDGSAITGTVRVGPGAEGACTVVFDRPWLGGFVCTVGTGAIARLTRTDLVVEQLPGLEFTYACEATR